MTSSRATRFAAFLVLFVLPLTLRMLPLTHGGERGYVPDAHIVRAALGMAKDHTLVPPALKYSSYPNLLPYLLLPIYGIQFLCGIAAHSWSNIKGFGDYVLAHPQHAAWPARALVALLGALTTWVVYRGARAAGLQRGAWVAAWLAATCLLDVHLSTHERPWAVVVLFMAASGWAAIHYVTTASTRALALSGLCAGLAVASHQSGLGALAIPGLAWTFGPLGWNNARVLRTRLVQGVVAVALFALVGLLLGYPGWIVHGRAAAQAVVGGAEVEKHANLTLGSIPIVFELNWQAVPRLLKSVFGYDPVLVVLGLAGLAFALRDRKLRALAIFTLLWSGFFLTNRSDHVRYLLPALVFLAWPAGLLAERWLAKPMGEPAIALLLALPLVQALRFDWLMTEPDTRATAEQKLSSLPAGTCIAIDRYGPDVDLDKPAIYRLETLRNSRAEPLRSREQFRKDQIDSGAATGGVNAVRIEELFEIDDRARTVSVRTGLEALGAEPRAVLRKLGVTHFLRVDRRPSAGEPDLLLGASPSGKLVWRVDPAGLSGSASEALLPTEMDFPITGLWAVERPGPLLELRTFE